MWIISVSVETVFWFLYLLTPFLLPFLSHYLLTSPRPTTHTLSDTARSVVVDTHIPTKRRENNHLEHLTISKSSKRNKYGYDVWRYGEGGSFGV